MRLNEISTIIGVLGSLSGVVYLIIWLYDRRPIRPKPIKTDGGYNGRRNGGGVSTPVEVDGATEFVSNERAYQNWLKHHSQGFVINTHARPDKRKDYTALHKASCSSISRYNDKVTSGAYTERDFIKVCANDTTILAKWAKRIGRTGEPFSGVCGLCKPIVPAPPPSPAPVHVEPPAPIDIEPQSNAWTPQEFARLLERCRALPPAKGNYIINDYVENVLLTVLDFMLNTTVVVNAAKHYKATVQSQVNDFNSLQNLLAQFPDDKMGNMEVAQYLWGYNLWTRVGLLRRLLNYLGEHDITTQEKLKKWAFQSDFNRDMAGQVKGIGFAIYKWLVMRQGVQTIKPDIWVHRFLKKSIGRDLNDFNTVTMLEAAAKEIGLKVYELDWRIWESQRNGTS